MQGTIFILAALLAGAAFAQQPSAPAGLSQQDMGALMQQAQQLQGCMQSLKPQTLERLQKEGAAAEARLKALCKEGRRDEAQAQALKLETELNQSPDMQALYKCGRQAVAMLKDSPLQKLTQPAADQATHHVCDDWR